MRKLNRITVSLPELAGLVVVSFIIGAMVAGLYAQYHSPTLSLWEDNARKNLNYRTYENAAFQMLEAKRYARALDYAQTAIAIDYGAPGGWNNAAAAAIGLGAWELAYQYTRELFSLTSDEEHAKNLFKLAVLLQKKDIDISALKRVIESGKLKGNREKWLEVDMEHASQVGAWMYRKDEEKL